MMTKTMLDVLCVLFGATVTCAFLSDCEEKKLLTTCAFIHMQTKICFSRLLNGYLVGVHIRVVP